MEFLCDARSESLSGSLPRDKILGAIPVTSSFPEGSQFGVIALPHDNRILVLFPTLEENPQRVAVTTPMQARCDWPAV